MTVIFHTNAGAPVLAGDMLLSKHGPASHTDLKLPSQPRGIVIPPDAIPSHIPITLRRKVFVVNNHMAVGVAGSVGYIRMFIEELKQEFSNKHSISFSEVNHYLDCYAATQNGQNILTKIHFVILVEGTDRQGSLTSGLQLGNQVASRNFGTVIAIGSGASSVINQINRLDQKYKYGGSQPLDGKDRFPEFDPLKLNLMLLGNLYCAEFVSPPTNLFAGWGGAYDLIYQDSHNVFQYLKEYSIYLRYYDVDNPQIGIQMGNIFKYERLNDLSLIAMLGHEGIQFFGAKDINLTSGVPLCVEISRDDFTMDSKIHISIVAVLKGNKAAAPLIVIDGIDGSKESEHLGFSRFDHAGRVVVAINSEFDDWLEQEVKSYCSKINW